MKKLPERGVGFPFYCMHTKLGAMKCKTVKTSDGVFQRGERRHEAALLRTLGARRGQLRVAAACEFALLGLIAGLTAAFGAAGAGLWLGHSVFHIDSFVPPLWPLAFGALGAAFVVMLLGLAGTRKVTRTSPMRLLREG